MRATYKLKKRQFSLPRQVEITEIKKMQPKLYKKLLFQNKKPVK